MQSRAEWMREIDMLLTGTEHERFARAKTLNVAATAFVLGVPAGQAGRIMRDAGYKGGKAGKSLLFDKSSVYDAAKQKGFLS